ncbi:hypothetical protein ACFV9P_28005 [Streptomyces sp. NPDC059892]|uniref:hypothetical protein n=1 Tax=Streptomyces sp. NPDC059892 TaxID=3346989 RepID=UPI00365FE803
MSDLAQPTPELSPVLDLLASVTEMLDVPTPDNLRDEGTYYRLLASRAAMLRGYLGSMVECQHEPTFHADGIREMTADLPVTYTPYASTEDVEAPAC